MNNIYDYIKWRGDLSFDKEPLNTVDILIFSMLSYTVLKNVINDDESISINEAATRYKKLNIAAVIDSYDMLDATSYGTYMLFAMENTVRYGEVLLSNYVDVFDINESIQFSVVTASLPIDIKLCLFRGTDATIDGWKEDFAISFSEVGAQKLAVEYINSNCIGDYKYILAGHSKGGNLAEYSAMMAKPEVKDRIVNIYSFDGPGICPEMTDEEKYKLIKDKLILVCPEFSVVGMLFRDTSPDVIVKSNATTLLQHGPFTWIIDGPKFQICEEIDLAAVKTNEIIADWIKDETFDNRRVFTEELFEAFKAGGAVTVTDVIKGGVKGTRKILKSLTHLDKEAKGVTIDLFSKLIVGATGNIKKVDKSIISKVLLNVGSWYSLTSMLIGIFFILVPKSSIGIFGIAFVAQIVVFCTFRIVVAHILKHEKRVLLTVLYSIFALSFIAFFIEGRIMHISSAIEIGIMFIVMAGVRLYNGYVKHKEKDKFSWILFVDGVLALWSAISNYTMMFSSHYLVFIKCAGIYLVIVNMMEMFAELLKNERLRYTS